jgi:hypothetical protein
MSQPQIQPSSYYPDYFKSELELGTPHELPFSKALDQAIFRFLLNRLVQIHQLSPESLNEDFLKLHLHRFGFTLDHLCPQQVHQIYDSLSELFQLRGTLAGLDLLATCHFDEFDSFQGHPSFHRQDLNLVKLYPTRVGFNDHQKEWIHYRLKQSNSPLLIQTFIKNATLFLPKSMQVSVSSPQPIETREVTSWTLSKPTLFKSRRI